MRLYRYLKGLVDEKRFVTFLQKSSFRSLGTLFLMYFYITICSVLPQINAKLGNTQMMKEEGEGKIARRDSLNDPICRFS